MIYETHNIKDLLRISTKLGDVKERPMDPVAFLRHCAVCMTEGTLRIYVSYREEKLYSAAVIHEVETYEGEKVWWVVFFWVQRNSNGTFDELEQHLCTEAKQNQVQRLRGEIKRGYRALANKPGWCEAYRVIEKELNYE